MATGSTTFGSHAATSTWKPGRTLNVLSASFGSVGGTRGRSSLFTVGAVVVAPRAMSDTASTTKAPRRRIAFIEPDYLKSRNMLPDHAISRRDLLAATTGAAAACLFAGCRSDSSPPTARPADHSTTRPGDPDAIIDIHQHTTYLGRSNAALLHHQYKMGVTQTILLPG